MMPQLKLKLVDKALFKAGSLYGAKDYTSGYLAMAEALQLNDNGFPSLDRAIQLVIELLNARHKFRLPPLVAEKIKSLQTLYSRQTDLFSLVISEGLELDLKMSK